MFAFVPALASFGLKAASAASAVQSATGQLTGSGRPNSTDTRERGPRAAQALQAALAGSLPEAQWILLQRFHAATQWARSVYAQAWQQLEQQNPALAAEAAKLGIDKVTQGNPSAREQLGNELERLWSRVRSEAANTVQRVAAGAGASAAEGVAGDESGSRFNVPVTRDTLMYVGLALIVGVLLLWFFSRRK